LALLQRNNIVDRKGIPGRGIEILGSPAALSSDLLDGPRSDELHHPVQHSLAMRSQKACRGWTIS
jgi:hypothetical protein